MDEPFGALDPITRMEVRREFGALQAAAAHHRRDGHPRRGGSLRTRSARRRHGRRRADRLRRHPNRLPSPTILACRRWWMRRFIRWCGVHETGFCLLGRTSRRAGAARSAAHRAGAGVHRRGRRDRHSGGNPGGTTAACRSARPVDRQYHADGAEPGAARIPPAAPVHRRARSADGAGHALDLRAPADHPHDCHRHPRRSSRRSSRPASRWA